VPTDQLHHSGVLTQDMDRAARFYLEAFEGHWLFKPAILEPPAAQAVYGGGPGVRFKFCYIGFRTGAIELVEFLGDDKPEFARDPARPPALPHFSLVVDDVAATIEKVVELGGSKLWADPVDWNGAVVQFIADPDGNPIELFNVGLDQIVENTFGMFPESRP
jgi:predicted enzyme related to lactoylglutathione lyase